MTRRILMLVGWMMVLGSVKAQLVQVSGYIFNSDSTGVVPYASIVNKKNKSGTQASINGFYTLLVGPGDSVEITAIGFKKAVLCLPKGYSGSSLHVDVPLKHLTYDLPTFTKHYTNMEIFTREFTAMKIPEEKRYITVSQGQITSKAPVSPNFGVTLNGPFTWLYNKFSRKTKEMEKLADLRSMQLEDYSASQRLTPQFISLATGLPEERTMEFADYCNISQAALLHYSNYDLIIALQRCLDSYKKDKNLTNEDLGITSDPLPIDTVNTNINTQEK